MQSNIVLAIINFIKRFKENKVERCMGGVKHE